MSYFSVPPLLTSLLFALLGSYVLLRRAGAAENRAYALWCYTTVYWQLCWTVLFSTRNPNDAVLLVKIGYSGIIFIPIAFYHFVNAFTHQSGGLRRTLIAYIIGICFCSTVWIDSVFLHGYYT